ncbi:hypothetical protein HPB48_005269 [Haemaphysalis longicornis]|uniref:Uncharacterized protein n=1 Tax=Haemaphysalis longicornis TaxID=44386 RepID=A0A9J6FL72_HAELO|nr:hypothetical protein HPB48_005269 [Haemaphysalis longicornis]
MNASQSTNCSACVLSWLVGYRWVTCRWGDVPENAVPGGKDKGETLYVGRAVHQDDLVPGKVHPSHRRCYVAYRGVEWNYGEYEVSTMYMHTLGRLLCAFIREPALQTQEMASPSASLLYDSSGLQPFH